MAAHTPFTVRKQLPADEGETAKAFTSGKLVHEKQEQRHGLQLKGDGSVEGGEDAVLFIQLAGAEESVRASERAQAGESVSEAN